MWAKAPKRKEPEVSPVLPQGLPRPSLRRRVQEWAHDSFRAALDKLQNARKRHAEVILQEREDAIKKPKQDTRKLLDYTRSYTAGLVRIARGYADRYNAQRRIPPVHESFFEPAYMLRGQAGDEILAALRSVFSRFPDKPTRFQWLVSHLIRFASTNADIDDGGDLLRGQGLDLQ